MTAHDAGARLSEADLRAAEEFLFHEAELLDEARFREWLELMDPDVRYRVYAPTVRGAGDRSGASPMVPLFSEDIVSLRSRVAQLATPELTVAENPRSVDRRFVANVRARVGASASEIAVRSNLLVRRARGVGSEPVLLSATRRDTLRRGGGSLRLASRVAQLDEPVVQARSLSLFF